MVLDSPYFKIETVSFTALITVQMKFLLSVL